MRFLVLVLLSVGVVGCAPDDQRFDTSALTPEHQALFQQAADDLNAKYPMLADFSTGSDGWSVVKYGQPNPGARCTRFDAFVRGFLAHRIICDGRYIHGFSAQSVYQTFRHEICHVIGFDHHEGNPRRGHC